MSRRCAVSGTVSHAAGSTGCSVTAPACHGASVEAKAKRRGRGGGEGHMTLWHTLRQEASGAWRSVRYDLDSHRAAKLADAFTEEFEAPLHAPEPSRMVPLAGVALLLAGGAA